VAKDKTGTSVAKPSDNGEAVANYDYGNYGAASESANLEELSMPYLNVLDTASKKVEEGMPKGGIYNSVTGIAIPACGEDAPGLNLVVCKREQYFVERVPYEDCKGVNSFVALHKAESDFVKAAIKANGGKHYGKMSVAGGKHELSESMYLYCLILDEECKAVDGYAVFELSSKNLRPWKNWYTSMMTATRNPALFIYKANVKTLLTANKKGKDSYEIKVTPLGKDWKDCRFDLNNPEEKAIADAGFQLFNLVKEGKITVNYSAMSDSEAQEDSEAARKAAETMNGEVVGEKPAF